MLASYCFPFLDINFKFCFVSSFALLEICCVSDNDPFLLPSFLLPVVLGSSNTIVTVGFPFSFVLAVRVFPLLAEFPAAASFEGDAAFGTDIDVVIDDVVVVDNDDDVDDDDDDDDDEDEDDDDDDEEDEDDVGVVDVIVVIIS